MALVFLGKSECPICGKVLQPGDQIVALSPLPDNKHPFWKYFDAGMHKSCYDNWDNKDEANKLLDSFKTV
jgi:hypothetical protein